MGTTPLRANDDELDEAIGNQLTPFVSWAF